MNEIGLGARIRYSRKESIYFHHIDKYKLVYLFFICVLQTRKQMLVSFHLVNKRIQTRIKGLKPMTSVPEDKTTTTTPIAKKASAPTEYSTKSKTDAKSKTDVKPKTLKSAITRDPKQTRTAARVTTVSPMIKTETDSKQTGHAEPYKTTRFSFVTEDDAELYKVQYHKDHGVVCFNVWYGDNRA